MIRAFELAFSQLTDPKLRGVLWQSLLLSLVLQIALIALAWWGLASFATFKWQWVNDLIRWLDELSTRQLILRYEVGGRKFLALVNKSPSWGAKNIMTGVNVASRMRRDSFVAEKIDNQLTANPADFTAAVTRTFSTRRLSAQRRQDQ